MADYYLDQRDIRFNLFEMLELGDKLLASQKYGELEVDDINMVLDEAIKFAKDVLAPTNEVGDREGCTLADGVVSMPKPFHEAYRLYCENGWMGINAKEEWGGAGMPDIMWCVINDIMFAANMSLNLCNLLTPGAARIFEASGSDAIRKTYLENMYTGKWTGTMCLTEPQAGSDVGAVATKARKEGDRYFIEGDKIFITYGEHDLAENIVHAVLARTEGAPKGTKGLSLFLVPKFLPKEDGSLGARNDVVCAGIEHKMGINASPTCQMSFGQNGTCEGFLIGEEGQGIRIMFQLMNEARILVGLQGSALASAAYLGALNYARERKQGSDIRDFKNPDAARVTITAHPDVRQSLLRQRAYSEGLRALVYFGAHCEDRAHVAETDEEKQHWHGLMALFTPICKAYATDMGFRVTEWALQTYGGYGFLKDYPAEQMLRDSKIASIYEGTNGIQAMDLITRKIGARGGADVMALAGMFTSLIKEHGEHPVLAPAVGRFAKAVKRWGEVNEHLKKAAGARDLMTPLLNAQTYLSLFGDLTVAYMLLWQATIAWQKLQPLCEQAGVDAKDDAKLLELAKENNEVRFYRDKLKSAAFFAAHELPNLYGKAESVESGDESAMAVIWDE